MRNEFNQYFAQTFEFPAEYHFQNSNVDRKQLLGRMSINDGTHLGGREDQPKGDVTPLVKWVTRGREG